MAGGVAQTVKLTLDFSQVGATAFPQGHVFVGLDVGSAGIQYQAIGTQSGGFQNIAYGLNQINGATVPNISGLCAYGTGTVQLCGLTSGIASLTATATGGNFLFNGGALAVTSGGTGDTGTGYTPYTPTLACGAGALTTSSASGRSKTIGKTVLIEVDITITTLGTCAGNLSVTVPQTPQAIGSLPGLNATTQTSTPVELIAGDKLYFLFASAPAANRYTASGSYESQ
jgi:hypothetical protein